MLYNNLDIYELIAVFIAVVVAITLHEYAHARVAVINGDYTPKQYGRLSLNPIKHFDLIGFLMMMLVGFGFAKPVPVNPNNFKRYRLGVFTVAIAGIATNIVLAFLVTPLQILTLKWLVGITAGEFVFRLVYVLFLTLGYIVVINISLALFNLLPFFPLDGFRVVESFTRYNNPVTQFLRNYGRYILFALIGISVIIDWFNLKINYPIFEYIDIIGFLISKIGGFISGGFAKLWSLILGGV